MKCRREGKLLLVAMTYYHIVFPVKYRLWSLVEAVVQLIVKTAKEMEEHTTW